MKKPLKKLNLHKETLRALDASDLKGVAAGALTNFKTCTCNSGAFTCPYTDTTCGTQLC